MTGAATHATGSSDGERASSARTGPGERYWATILSMIDASLADPELSAHQVARAAGISARYVQHLCTRHGKTFAGLVRVRRLERAQARLSDHPDGSVNITTLAMDCGFPSATVFARLFRQRYGMTPSAWQRCAIETGQPPKRPEGRTS